ncbi:GGDEF domain-containing protein [Azorhizobium doebereinerae]|uniref:GGDEF domain-containing protein n=1 Tax=Azorhizobium doebereinerae TaxID=281091 RepID=UPI0003F6CE73|nr:diguanylate cyclase [Azorhizobium doebereinerae]
MYLGNFLVIAAQMAIYFGGMLALFRARRLIGIGAFFCALGTTHFLETYLAISFYLKMPFGLALSPGSAMLFSGKIALLLLTYIREDAPVARQPLYGMLLGNVVVFLLVATLAIGHTRLPLPIALDVPLLGKYAVLMLWGNLLLFVECLGMFVLYERLARASRLGLWLPAFIALVLALTIDQIGYFTALHFSFNIPLAAGLGGWLGKLAAAAVFSGVLAWYLTHIEAQPATGLRDPHEIWRAMRPGTPASRPATRRYDPLTGTFHTSQFEPICDHLLSVTTLTGRPMSLLLMHIDGQDPAAPDLEERNAVVRRVGEALGEGIRSGDYVVRYHDNIFAILTPGAPHQAAMQVAALLRRETEAVLGASEGPPHTLSIGVATTPQDGSSVSALLRAAEQRVQEARRLGPNQVAGMFSG